ncbi:MAG TPA: hypothetical protein DCX79_21280, partial [Planctomycetaceae bacterium]|nr:hypothetical protein [Planctomycetaceae bacterium]
MNLQDRVVLNPDVLAGKPVIRGTRLAAEFIVDLPGQGCTESQVLENYPGIAHENIPAALTRSLRAAGHDVNWVSEISPGITDTQVIE